MDAKQCSMAPKKEKGPKQLLAASQLTAFQNVYKAACKRYSIPPDKPLLEEIEQKLQDFKHLEKVSFRGPQHGPGSLCAVLDGLAGYPAVKNLQCWGCSIGDEGLFALSQLMRASVDKLYGGSKLRLLEIVHDGAGTPAERWPERYRSQANGEGGMVTRGPGYQLPSLALGHTQAVTLDTVRLQPEAGNALDLSSLERQLIALMASTSTSTTALLYDTIGQARTAAAAATGEGGTAGAAVHPGIGRPMLFAPPPQAFSSEVLKDFSLALGAQGHKLQVLVLDHNQLGDQGAKLLAPGLKRCAPLVQLSLAHCGIGPAGAAALSASLHPDPNRQLAEAQPKYKFLNLSGNPLCAEGVKALASGLPYVTSLKVLLLAGVELSDSPSDLQALQALGDALALNTSIDQVDLDANAIGDAGATALLPFLQSQRHLRKFRLTPRLSRPVMAAVSEAVRANLPKKKATGLKKKKAAKK